MTNATLAIIGAGNMGKSLLAGLINKGYPAGMIWVSDPDPAVLQALQMKWLVNVTTNNAEAVQGASIVMLAVKPQVIFSVMHGLASIIQVTKPLVISIAAGVEEQSIESVLGSQIAVVRCMPNTPAQIGFGMTACHANALVSETQRQQATAIMQAVGQVLWLESEKQMNAVTALSGSGPAYFFLFMDALVHAGCALGLSLECAKQLTLATADGAIQMAKISDKTLPELQAQVTSKGGTTEQALKVLDDHHLRGLMQSALIAACDRSQELADTLKKEIGVAK